MLGKLVVGAVLDKFGAKMGIIFCMGLIVLSLIFFMKGGTMVMAALFVLAFAMGGPVATVWPSFIAGHLFGNLDYGTIYGFVQIFITLGMAFAMPVTGAVYDSTGSLMPVWWAFVVLGIVILLLFLLILGRQPKLRNSGIARKSDLVPKSNFSHFGCWPTGTLPTLGGQLFIKAQQLLNCLSNSCWASLLLPGGCPRSSSPAW